MEAADKILCIGNICVDIKAYSSEDLETEAYRDGSIEIVAGGVGRGMALNLKQLGLNSVILSVVGQDIFGDFLKKELESKNVDTTLLRTSTEHKTALFSVMRSGTKPASCVYNTNIIKELSFDQQIKDYIKTNNIKTLVMDSNLRDETYEEIYNFKKDNPDIFIFQNATAPDLAGKTIKYAELIDLYACNEFEAAALTGQEEIPDLTVVERFKKLGLNNFIITFGSQGVLVHINGETWIEPPYKPQNIVDTIGAGDALASGFLMGYLNNEPVKTCIHYGLACAKETLSTKQTVCDLLSQDLIKTYPKA